MQAMLDAFAHPQRRALLQLVMDREVPVGELVSETGMSQPMTSQHLRVLRDAGLVSVRVDGPRRLYRADSEGVARLRSELDAFWTSSLTRLKRTAEEET